MTTLFEKLGGAPAVDAAVDIFYRKVLSDDRIADYFDGVDMAEQANKQKSFLTMVFGGPNSYEGKDLRSAHAGMKGLSDIHVDAVIENLGGTLAELGVAEDLIAEVAGIANSVRDDVLNR
ncbi:MAG: group I truncated hemoglobin [Cellvibrionaceae bacterium]